MQDLVGGNGPRVSGVPLVLARPLKTPVETLRAFLEVLHDKNPPMDSRYRQFFSAGPLGEVDGGHSVPSAGMARCSIGYLRSKIQSYPLSGMDLLLSPLSVQEHRRRIARRKVIGRCEQAANRKSGGDGRCWG